VSLLILFLAKLMSRCSLMSGPFCYCLPLRFHTVSVAISAEHELMDRFEGMKAYRQEDDTVRLFRPDKNMARMNRVCKFHCRSTRKLMSRVQPVWLCQ
jgi:hypothetical protein